VNEGRVDHGGQLGKVEKVGEIAEMSVAAAHSVASTVLVQHEYLAWTEPSLHTPANRLCTQHRHQDFNDTPLCDVEYLRNGTR